jgi:hypothetical protein
MLSDWSIRFQRSVSSNSSHDGSDNNRRRKNSMDVEQRNNNVDSMNNSNHANRIPSQLSYTDLKQRFKMRRIHQLNDIISDQDQWKEFHRMLRNNNQSGYTNTSVKESLSVTLLQHRRRHLAANQIEYTTTTKQSSPPESLLLLSDESLGSSVTDYSIASEDIGDISERSL